VEDYIWLSFSFDWGEQFWDEVVYGLVGYSYCVWMFDDANFWAACCCWNEVWQSRGDGPGRVDWDLIQEGLDVGLALQKLR